MRNFPPSQWQDLIWMHEEAQGLTQRSNWAYSISCNNIIWQKCYLISGASLAQSQGTLHDYIKYIICIMEHEQYWQKITHTDSNERHRGKAAFSCTSCGVQRLVLHISKPLGVTHRRLHNIRCRGVGRRVSQWNRSRGASRRVRFTACSLCKASAAVLQQAAHKRPRESEDLCSLHQLSISPGCKGISSLPKPQENQDPFLLVLLVFVAFYHLRQQIRFPPIPQIPFSNANKRTNICQTCSSCMKSC